MKTQASLITPSRHQSSNWPGGIATASVFSSSADGSPQPFWRIGELVVSNSGSMPQLEGFSRHIALLEGEGILIMHGDTERTELLEQGENGGMDLADANAVELIDGSVRLLDLVVNSSKYSTSAFVLGDEENMHPVDAELLILYGLEGERMHCILDESEFTLSAQQWMQVENPAVSDIQCTEGKVLVLALRAI